MVSAVFFGFRRSTVPVSRVIDLTLSGRGSTLWSAFGRLEVEAFAVASHAASVVVSALGVLAPAAGVVLVPWVWLAVPGAVVFVLWVCVGLPG